MKVEIIIPVNAVNDYVRESIPEILKLDYQDFSILLLPDETTEEQFQKTRIIPTGKTGPAEKRDLALQYSDADIFAFLDDDAYPRKDWLTNAMKHFRNPEVGAVGGPAVTPEHDTFWQKVSGAVFLSKIGGGSPERYIPDGEVREVDDWPSVNLLVRRSVFEEVGGFDSSYWPGEDTKLCLDIIESGKKIIYDPEVFVWHHRREGLARHLKQIGGYGLHRGYFAKVYPKTSRKLPYFIPSCFSLFVLSALFSLFLCNPIFTKLHLAGFILYFLALGVAFLQINRIVKNPAITLCSIFYIVTTHFWYGIRFLQGFLFTKNLKSTLRS